MQIRYYLFSLTVYSPAEPEQACFPHLTRKERATPDKIPSICALSSEIVANEWKSKVAAPEGRLIFKDETVLLNQGNQPFLLGTERENLSTWQSGYIKNLLSFQNGPSELRLLSEGCVLILSYEHVTFAAFLILGLSILTTYGVHAIARLEAWSLALLVLFLVLCVAVVLTIWRQPQNQQKVAFMVCVTRMRNPKYYAHFILYISFYELFLKKKPSDDINQ